MRLQHTFVALAALGCVSAAQAGIYTFTGDTTGEPTFNRLYADLTGPSPIGTATAYDTFDFSIDTSGVYTFLTTAEFDPTIFLYAPAFVAATPATGVLYGSDDLDLGGTVVNRTTAGFEASLTAGTSYVLVTAGFNNTDSGDFSTTIGGPGTVITAAVPEPQTYALLALGLGALGIARRYARTRGG